MRALFIKKYKWVTIFFQVADECFIFYKSHQLFLIQMASERLIAKNL